MLNSVIERPKTERVCTLWCWVVWLITKNVRIWKLLGWVSEMKLGRILVTILGIFTVVSLWHKIKMYSAALWAVWMWIKHVRVLSYLEEVGITTPDGNGLKILYIGTVNLNRRIIYNRWTNVIDYTVYYSMEVL